MADICCQGQETYFYEFQEESKIALFLSCKIDIVLSSLHSM